MKIVKQHIRHASLASGIGWSVALIAYFLVFAVTGNSDILFAVGTGVVTITLTWIGLYARYGRPDA